MRMFSYVSSLWAGSENQNWRGYKATSILALVALGKNLVENYWVMTDTPLAGNVADPAAKAFYLIGQSLFALTMGGSLGLVIDYERSRYHSENTKTETTPFMHL
jgi:hypothetical protein